MRTTLQLALRAHLKEMYGSRYSKLDTQDSWCYYCGEPRECWDHCPPLAMSECWDSNHLEKAPKHFLVPCCNACNHALGSKPIVTLLTRLQYLETFFLRKFEKRFHLWHPDEIEEMSQMFQKIIASEKKKAEFLRDKVRHIQRRIVQHHRHDFED